MRPAKVEEFCKTLAAISGEFLELVAPCERVDGILLVGLCDHGAVKIVGSHDAGRPTDRVDLLLGLVEKCNRELYGMGIEPLHKNDRLVLDAKAAQESA